MGPTKELNDLIDLQMKEQEHQQGEQGDQEHQKDEQEEQEDHKEDQEHHLEDQELTWQTPSCVRGTPSITPFNLTFFIGVKAFFSLESTVSFSLL